MLLALSYESWGSFDLCDLAPLTARGARQRVQKLMRPGIPPPFSYHASPCRIFRELTRLC